MVARTKPLSRVLDALALLLGLPQWDKENSRHQESIAHLRQAAGELDRR
jgi:hypothetical protein